MHLYFLAIIYIITAKGHLEVSDTEYSVRTAISILESGSLLILPPDNDAVSNFPESGNLQKIFSPYGIGLALIFIPFVIVSKILCWLTGLELRILLDFLLSFYNIPFALMGLYFFQRITTQLGAPRSKSIMITLCLGISTCYWKYTVTDFSEIVQVCFLLASIFTILDNKDKMWKELSFFYSFLVLIKLTYFVFFPFLIILFLTENIRNKKSIIINNFLKSCTYIVPTCIFIALLNFFRFSNVFESGYGSAIQFSKDYLIRDWFGYLCSYERGVLTFNPILFLTLAGLFFIPHQYKKSITIISLTALIWYFTMCFWVSWQGGYCWGNRLLTPIVPLLLLPLVFLDFNTLWSKILFALTLIGSTIIQFAASFTKVHEIIEIKLNILQLTEQIPHSQLWRGIELFFHKLKSPDAEYLASSFGIENTEVINLTSFSTFHGFNLWIVHLLNHLGLSTNSHFAGILLLTVITLLCISLFVILLTSNRFINID